MSPPPARPDQDGYPPGAAAQLQAPTPMHRAAFVVLGTALAYAVAGVLSLLLAVPPSLVSPLYPAAGIALAAVLVFGRVAGLGVFLGTLVVEGVAHWQLDRLASSGTAGPSGWSLAAIVVLTGAGAALQSLVGRWLVLRLVRTPVVLAELRDVARFMVGGAALACMVSATTGSLSLWAWGGLPASAVPNAWATWWLGDTLGVLIGAPAVLTLIGQPRAEWVGRRLTVALPLMLATALLAMGTLVLTHWDLERKRTVFERDAAMASAALQARLSHTEDALDALLGVYAASDDVTAREFDVATRPWLLRDPALHALGFSQRVAAVDRDRFVRLVQKEDGRPISLFERPSSTGGQARKPFDDLMVIRHIAPTPGNANIRGLDAMTVPAARDAILQSVADNKTVASAPFVLTQMPEGGAGMVLYRALYNQPAGLDRSSAGAARGLGAQGVVFATMHLPKLVNIAQHGSAAYLDWCLVDTLATSSNALLFGRPGCLADRRADRAAVRPINRASLFEHRQTFAVGERQWQLILGAEPRELDGAVAGNALPFVTIGLASTAVLSALLLVLTGRTRRIEVAVHERTADLQHEVAEHVRTAQALQASEQRLRNIFDHAPVGIVIADVDARVREANPAMRELVGLGADQLIGQDLLALAMPADRAVLLEAINRLLLGKAEDQQRQARLVHRDGSHHRVQISWSVLHDGQGQAQWLVAVVENITERLKREEAEQGRRLAESANQAKNEFLSRMSHELRTPLNAMLGFSQLLEIDRRPVLAAHQTAWVAQILQSGWHLLEMINETLDLSRIEAGVVQVQNGPVALAPACQQCVAMLSQAAADRQVQVHLSVDAGAAWVLADETRLKQVLSNLISNAIKYNARHGEVWLQATAGARGEVTLRVRDTGGGLSAEQIGELFQPFNRLGRETGQTEGTGIGLVISRRLAELMGGSLHAESTPEGGATFVLSLQAAAAPVAGALDGEPDQADPAAESAWAVKPGGRKHLVLYVEDNQTNVEVMRGVLRLRPSVQLQVCAAGQQGLDQARRQPPDLILLDMHLPDMDGLSLLRRLREDPVTARVPVVAVSADAIATRVADVLAAGARDYLTKPVNVMAFLTMLDALLEDASAGEGVEPSA